MLDPERFIKAARTWLGTRWHHQGRSKKGGVDCIGLCLCVAQECGLDVQDITGYSRRPEGSRLLAALQDRLLPVPLTEKADGDIGLFREQGFPVHVGILSTKNDSPSVIHAHAARRQVVEEALAIFGNPFLVFRIREMQTWRHLH